MVHFLLGWAGGLIGPDGTATLRLRWTDSPQPTSHMFSCHWACKYEMKWNFIPSQNTHFVSNLHDVLAVVEDTCTSRWARVLPVISTLALMEWWIDGRMTFPHDRSDCVALHELHRGPKLGQARARLQRSRRPFLSDNKHVRQVNALTLILQLSGMGE